MAVEPSAGKSSGRAVARIVLRRVHSQRAYATLALSGELRRASLSDPERRLATQLVYGVLRRRVRLDRALAAMTPRGLGKTAPAVMIALRVAAYQLLFLDRIPAHAAVNDAVSAVRRLGGQRIAGFANGVLRRLAREGEPPLPDSPRDRLVVETSLPEWVLDLLEAEVGGSELVAAARALSEEAPLTVRANALKCTRDELAVRLAEEVEGVTTEPSPLADHALFVGGLGSPERSPAFLEGAFTVQDVGAQLVSTLVAPRPGESILDACAGVGGKTTHLAELTGNRAHIDAADVSRSKLDLLEDSARRLGANGIRTIEADLTRGGGGLKDQYDRVVLDAPCSGLGVLRRHPELVLRGDGERTAELVQLQSTLLDAVAPRVRPGGCLIYSVCTFTPAEGPGQMAEFLSREPGFSPDGWIRTWPHHHRADAFFAARLVRCA